MSKFTFTFLKVMNMGQSELIWWLIDWKEKLRKKGILSHFSIALFFLPTGNTKTWSESRKKWNGLSVANRRYKNMPEHILVKLLFLFKPLENGVWSITKPKSCRPQNNNGFKHQGGTNCIKHNGIPYQIPRKTEKSPKCSTNHHLAHCMKFLRHP